MTRRVVILEPDLDGHHAFWLALMIEAHRRAGWAAEVIAPADISLLRGQMESRGFGPESATLHAAAGADERELLAQARRIARETGAERILIAFLDRFWGAILAEAKTGTPDGGAKLAGIWFHPHALDARWAWFPPLEKRWAARGRVHRFLRTPAAGRRFAAVYFPIEESTKRWRGLAAGVPAFTLPDPYEREPRLSREAARRALGMPEDRLIFLHLGSPERRKGLPDALEAFERLAGGARAEAEWTRPPLLLRVGPNERLAAGERARLARLVARGRARTVERFVPAEELMEYFSACDWVLIPYRKFRFSSGILANAIGAGRPVIVPDYGEVGGETVRGRLGLTYARGCGAGLARVLTRALDAPELADTFSADLKTARRGRTAEALVSALSASLAPFP